MVVPLNLFNDFLYLFKLKIEWKNNGAKIQGDDLNIDWMMEKGKHHFEAEVYFEDGHVEKTQTINVTVL